MTDVCRAIEERVEGGSVLNSEGRWVHMFELLTHEQRVIDELARGNVNVNGIWVRISDARKWAKSPKPAGAVQAASPVVPIPLSTAPIKAVPSEAAQFEAQENMLETISMDASVVNQIRRMTGAAPAPIAAPAKAAAPAAAIPAAPAKVVPAAAVPAAPVGEPEPEFNAAGETDSFDADLVGLAMSGGADGGTADDFGGQGDFCETTVMHVERIMPLAERRG